MDYSKLVEVYEELEATTKKLEKTLILSKFLQKVSEKDLKQIMYLLQGSVFPKWDERKIGMSSRLTIKAINSATGAPQATIEKEWAKIGDLGKVIEKLIGKGKQTSLFHKKLTVDKIFNNFTKLTELQGKGAVAKKIQLITDLLTSASPKEAKYIARTITEDLRIGVAEGLIRDSLVWAYLPKVEHINAKHFKTKSSKTIDSLEKLKPSDLKLDLIKTSEKEARKIYNHLVDLVQDSFNKINDFGEVALEIKKLDFKSAKIKIGTPINPMLAIKAEDVQDAFKAVGKPLQADYKLDGFRIQIHKDKEIKLFTRRLENVTKQFQEIVPIIKKHVKAKSYILDTEVVGFDHTTNKYLSFQHISQRIKRKYDIEKKSKDLPVEINVFDILYKNGENLMDKTQKERSKILQKIIKQEKRKIVIVKKLISSKEKEIEKFYKQSLNAGNEGLILKNLEAKYTPGRKVGKWVKLKPVKETLDLAIVSAQWGEGKRAKWLSSFTLACRDKGKFLTIGKVGTGIAEKENETGLSFPQLTKELKKHIIKEKGKHVELKPKIVLEITYEEIQKSPTYKSGFALRFPRTKLIRRDRSPKECDNLERIKKFYKKQKK